MDSRPEATATLGSTSLFDLVVESVYHSSHKSGQSLLLIKAKQRNYFLQPFQVFLSIQILS